MNKQNTESEKIIQRYNKRAETPVSSMYGVSNPCVYMWRQELERKFLSEIISKISSIKDRTLLEIGCGSGVYLADMIKYGFSPGNLSGIDLIGERIKQAKVNLPASVLLSESDALDYLCQDKTYDFILQSTVFTSILDRDVKKELAEMMWNKVKPGGGIIWYDFIYNNPRNPDVKGVPLAEVKKLFPYARIKSFKVTLAPPVCRTVVRIYPIFYTILNLFPFLRTHILCWIEKPEKNA